MFLLLDECCAKSLIRVAEQEGHTAQRTTDVGELGPAATDHDIFLFARRSGAVLVTINAGDFLRLSKPHSDHCGLLLLPSLP